MRVGKCLADNLTRSLLTNCTFIVLPGNMGIKALLQLMAASEAGIPILEFYCFGDEAFESAMRACLDRLGEADATVGDLWRWMKEYEKVLAPSRLELATSPKEHYGLLDFIAKGTLEDVQE